MKNIIIVMISIMMISCNKSADKKLEVKTPKKEKIITFNIEKKCSFCHDLPKFSEKTDSYIEKVLLEHNKSRRIKLKKKEFDALLNQVQKLTK